MDQTERAAFWHRAARRTARKLNVAWWWQQAAPWWLMVGAAGFAVIFWLRSRHEPLDAGLAAGVLAAALAGVAGIAWWRARRHFASESVALVALESRLRLHNALTAAEAGHAPWPEAASLQPGDGLRWSWRWLGGPPLAAAAFVAAAFFLPVPKELGAAQAPMTPPLAWPEMESWLDQLKENEVIDPEQLTALQQKLEELRAQAEKDWYSHESLEATDALRDSLDRSVEQMGADLRSGERSLSALEKYSDQLSAEAKDMLAADFQNALQGLRANELKLDPELMKKLAALDVKNLQAISAEQMQQLREAMKKKAGSCAACENGGKPGFLGDGEGEDDEEMAALMKLLQGGPKDGMGQGGVQRGPGTAPLFLGEEESRLGTHNQESLRNEDLSRAAPADLIGLGEKEHEIDRAAVGAREGGAAAAGQGGERVWKDDLTPDERAVLKRYFK